MPRMTREQAERLYRETDRHLKRVQKLLRREFNRFTVTSFDELNVIRTRHMVKETVERLNGCNHKGYRRIAKYVDDWFLFDVLLADDDVERIDAKKTVDRVLESYNPVTGYVYKRELDRKRSRLVEEILTSVQLQDRQRYEKVLHKAANLFFTQSMQYAVDVADETLKEEMEKQGVDEVVWLTEQDEKVCAECHARDGKIYKIDKIPPKPHYNCRCITVPVFD